MASRVKHKKTAISDGFYSGDEGTRTPDLLIANQPLSQLSYIPAPIASRVYTTRLTIVKPNSPKVAMAESFELTIDHFGLEVGSCTMARGSGSLRFQRMLSPDSLNKLL